VHVILFAFLIGVIAGLRAFTAPGAVSWAARLGWLPLAGTPLAFLGFRATPYIITALAIFELVNDQLPKTPSRKVPAQFIPRILLGGLSGAAIGAGFDSLWAGLVCGAIGAVAGTYGGAAVRGWLAGVFGRDLPAGLLEDVVALAGAYLIVTRV